MTEARGRPCRKCGADDWKQRANGHWYCAPCDRRTSAKRAERSGGALKLWELARSRAQRRGVPFDITMEDVVAVWPADGKCPALGIELRRGVGRIVDASPTLDRLNPEWGYTQDNIVVISNAANRIKNNARASDLERIAAWMRARGLD